MNPTKDLPERCLHHACSAARGYETFIKGAELTMRFDTNEDAVAFFDWVMANTHHKKQNAEVRHGAKDADLD